jgi:hypothetical protein
MVADFELSYGALGVGRFPFVIPSPELKAWIEAKYPLSATLDVLPNWLSDDSTANQERLGVPPPAPLPPVGLNELYVPPRPCEFSVFRGLVHRDDVTGMVAASNSFGGAGGTLIMRSGATTNGPIGIWGYVTFAMSMLPPRPLAGRDDAADLFLVTLVNLNYWGRFTFQGSTYSSPSIDEGFGDSWDGFVGTPAGAVYQYTDPDSELYGQVNRLDIFREAVCANVGRAPGGRGWFYDPALGVLDQYPRWAAANAYQLAARARWKSYRIAGGVISADPSVADSFRVQYMPKTFVVSFPEWVEQLGWLHRFPAGPPSTQTLFPRTWQPSSYSSLYQKFIDASTDLGSPYSNWLYRDHIAVGEAVMLQTTMKAIYKDNDPNASPPDNQAALNALAAQLVKDYLDANSVQFDETYQGIIPFPTAGHSYVLYKYGKEPTTRVWRAPFLGSQTMFQHGGVSAQLLPAVAFVKINGAAFSGDYYPALVNGDINLPVTVYDKQLSSGSGGSLQNGKYYKGIVTGARIWGASSKALYEVHDPDPVAPPLTINSTLVSGGTANAVLYTDGTKLQAGGNVLVSGSNSTLRQQVAANQWVGTQIGSN